MPESTQNTKGIDLPVGFETVEQFLTRTLTDDGSLQTAGTPQNQALVSLITNFPTLDPNLGANDQTQITQVYALNTIYFSTDGPNWSNRDGWTGAIDPCTVPTWQGIVCDSPLDESVAEVTVLDLGDNDLLGVLPSEIRGLSSLCKSGKR